MTESVDPWGYSRGIPRVENSVETSAQTVLPRINPRWEIHPRTVPRKTPEESDGFQTPSVLPPVSHFLARDIHPFLTFSHHRDSNIPDQQRARTRPRSRGGRHSCSKWLFLFPDCYSCSRTVIPRIVPTIGDLPGFLTRISHYSHLFSLIPGYKPPSNPSKTP